VLRQECSLGRLFTAQAGLLPWLDAQHRRYFIARDEHKVRSVSPHAPSLGAQVD